MKVDYVLLVLGMGLVTYLPRWMPLVLLSRHDLPQWLRQWLDLIPVSVLSALVLPAVATGGEPRHLDVFQPALLVSIPLFVFAWKTRSLAGTVLLGMALFWVAGRFF